MVIAFLFIQVYSAYFYLFPTRFPHCRHTVLLAVLHAPLLIVLVYSIRYIDCFIGSVSQRFPSRWRCCPSWPQSFEFASEAGRSLFRILILPSLFDVHDSSAASVASFFSSSNFRNHSSHSRYVSKPPISKRPRIDIPSIGINEDEPAARFN